MHNILIVCTGNICRSPMAEGWLKSILQKTMKNEFDVFSAGTYAIEGNQAEQNAIKVMEDFGIDISDHSASALDEHLVKEASFIFVMEELHKEYLLDAYDIEEIKIHLLSDFNPQKNLIHEIFDPYGMSVDAYKDCALLIRECLKNVVSFLDESLN